MNNLLLSELYIYPIKSLGGISLNESKIEAKGLQLDRRWMLVDESGMFITQRKYHQLALLEVKIVKDQLVVSHKIDHDRCISFPLIETLAEETVVNIWDDESKGVEVSKVVSQWFSNFMNMKVKLVKMPENEQRLVDPKYASDKEIVSFADGYPCLIIGQSSLNLLNQKLDNSIRMDRFRPNFVFTGGEAHIEDRFQNFSLSGIHFTAVKPCARCILITIDQQTGIKTADPLATLAHYRKQDNKIIFGQNLIHKGEGIIKVGDELLIQKWK